MSKIEVNTVDTQCGTNLTVGAACKSVTVAGNDIRSNAYKAGDGGNLVSQSGTTITLGASGDTVTLASGASQSGFGRAGSVDWDTSIKTTGFTAVSGNGYFCNTTSGAFTVTLPASPSAGDIVAVKDYANTFDTNNLTLDRNGSNIDGAASNFTLDVEGIAMTFVYADATKGWLTTSAGKPGDAIVPLFVTATGGTITTCGNFKIHTFTGPGTFAVSCAGNSSGSNKVDYYVLAGGGGGGSHGGAGGAAGGWRASDGTSSGSYSAGPGPLTSGVSGLTVSATPYPISVGGGGGAVANNAGNSGGNSVFSTITSAGGGGGGGGLPTPAPQGTGKSGGSGGGGGGSGAQPGGAGNTPPVSPPQGHPGGDNKQPGFQTGGGGGAGGDGGDGTPGAGPAGSGGPGVTSHIPGSPITKGGGGGGSSQSGANGSGGPGGGTSAISSGPGSPINAGSNTGAGAGGNHQGPPNTGGNGGSGIVILRYKYQ